MIINIKTHKICNQEKPLRGDIVVHRVINFDANTGKEMLESFNKALAIGQPIFPVVIDSYGGQVYSLQGCIDIFESSPIPVATIVQGKAMSCGSFLAAFGTKGYRYIGKNSHILIHHLNNTIHGITPQIKECAKHTEVVDKELFEKLSVYCGHQTNYFQSKLQQFEGADWYVSPEEAIAMNLVDRIGIPTLNINLKLEYGLQI
jgi:ATP-dependent Clp protease protease subunit